MDVNGAINAYLIENCNFSGSWYHILLAFILFIPTALTFVFFGVSRQTRQVFWLFMSFSLAIDWGINTLISGWTSEAAPVETCGGPRAFPSFMTEHSFFMYTYLIMSNHFFNLNLTWWDILLLQIWVLLTWIASIELGYNSYKQALVGALIGNLLSFFSVVIINMFIRPFRKYMLRKGILHFFNYRDTIFEADDLSIILSETDIPKLKNIIDHGNYDKSNIESLWDLLVSNFHNTSVNSLDYKKN